MNFRSVTFFIASLSAALIASTAIAQQHSADAIRIDHSYARASMPGQTSGGAYLTLENRSDHTDTLVAVQSPAAQSVEIHTMAMSGNVMRMREIGEIDIKPGEKITMRPGEGYHLMLMGLKAPLKAGDRLPLTLTFRKSGKVETTVMVDDGSMNHSEMSHHH